MRTAADLQPAAGYDDRWVVLAGAALAAVALYYLLAWWLTRPRRARPPRRRTSPREECLAALAGIERSVAAAELSPREGHQQVSRVVRAYVEQTSEVPAGTMTLAGLRREGPEKLAELVAVLYPPEFAPGDERAARDLPDALGRARELVTTWS